MRKSKTSYIRCSECKGTGFINIDKKKVEICPNCWGNGELDFIDNILGKRIFYSDLYDALVETVADAIAKGIDKEIIETYLKERVE